MRDKADPIMNHIQYAEVLVGKALSFGHRSKADRKAVVALLLSALNELQAEMGKMINDAVDPSE